MCPRPPPPKEACFLHVSLVAPCFLGGAGGRKIQGWNQGDVPLPPPKTNSRLESSLEWHWVMYNSPPTIQGWNQGWYPLPNFGCSNWISSSPFAPKWFEKNLECPIWTFWISSCLFAPKWFNKIQNTEFWQFQFSSSLFAPKSTRLQSKLNKKLSFSTGSKWNFTKA